MVVVNTNHQHSPHMGAMPIHSNSGLPPPPFDINMQQQQQSPYNPQQYGAQYHQQQDGNMMQHGSHTPDHSRYIANIQSYQATTPCS